MKANAPEMIYLQQYDENTLICLNKWNVSEEWSNKLVMKRSQLTLSTPGLTPLLRRLKGI